MGDAMSSSGLQWADDVEVNMYWVWHMIAT